MDHVSQSDSDRDREDLKQELLSADGGCHESSSLGLLIGCDIREIESLEEDLRVFSVPDGDRILCPLWQFDANGRPYPGVARVLAAWKHENPYSLLAFFIDTHEALNRVRPLDLLRAGDIEALLDLVRYENAANGLAPSR